MRPFVRAALVVALSPIILLSGLSVYFRIEQYGFRRQAEQLLGDVRELELKKASAEEVRLVSRKWGFEELQRQGKPCTEGDCRYFLRLRSPTPEHLYEYFLRGRRREMVIRVLALLGHHPAMVECFVDTGEKKLRYMSVRVSMLVGGNDGYDYTLIGLAGNTPGGGWSGRDRPDVKLKHSLLHSTYLVGTYPATLNPDSGPFPGVVVWAQFSPDANRSDKSRLIQFDLSCLTRLRACGGRDLMPTVWAQSIEDSRSSARSLTCTSELSSHVALLADVIAVARPKTVTLMQPSYEGWSPQLSDLEIVSVIKKPRNPRLHNALNVEVDNPEMMNTADTRFPITIGQQYVFLLQVHEYGDRDSMALYPCGILTVTDANLAMVREAASLAEQTE